MPNQDDNEIKIAGRQRTSLYHKQERKYRRKSPDYRPAGGVRKGPSRSRGMSHVWKNVRILAFVFFCMILLLTGAMYIAKRGGKRIATQSKKRVDLLKKELPAVSVPEGELALDKQTIDRMTIGGNEYTLDTSAIRKAVFLHKRGKKLAEGGDLDGAIELYREALDVWPPLTLVWIDLGQAFLRKEEYVRAQIALERSVEQDPSNIAVLNDLGVAYLYQGNVEKAVSLFAAATEIDETFADSYFNLALCYQASSKNDEARVHFERYLRMKPEDVRTLKELAYLDAVDGKYEQSVEKLKRAIEVNGEWSALYFDAAAASALLGRLEATFAYLETALELTSPHIVYRIYQGGAFREMRETELGRAFEENLADRAREQMDQGEDWQDEVEEASVAVETSALIEAISSVTNPLESTE